jgi:DNA-binding NtrC family response regulator
MDKIRILLADDDTVFCRLVGDLFSRQDPNYQLSVANDGSHALELLTSINFDILMLDMCFPALEDGFNLLEEAHRLYPKLSILMISGSSHIPEAVRSIQMGASDFIEKPVEPEQLWVRIRNLGERLLRERQVLQLARTVTGMVGVSGAMKQVIDDIITAAGYETPVLITGETGVGKELAATAVHRLSEQGDKSMVKINCASVPKELFEAELFGYEKGAFTGAVAPRKGYFEFARDTSIFLDEISELPLSVQAKLLRVISEREIQKLGGKVTPVRTRIITASNQDLRAMIASGAFREDLFYRLNAIHIRIPPLRERREDIPALAQTFLDDFCRLHKQSPRSISQELLAWLAAQPWKGNARELKNCVERVAIFSRKEVLEVVDFTARPCRERSGEPGTISLREALLQYEANLILLHLKANDYNISQTAQHLRMDKSNLSKRIRALGLELKESG